MKRAFDAIQNYPDIYIIIYFTVLLSVTTKMRESYSHSYVFDYNIFLWLSILQSKHYCMYKCVFFYIMFMVH